MTISADPYPKSIVEALSLSFRDQMSIFLFYFAEIRHIIRSESDDAKKKQFLCRNFKFFMKCIGTKKASSLALGVSCCLFSRLCAKDCSYQAEKKYFSPV